jgi:Chaperone of endosialidase
MNPLILFKTTRLSFLIVSAVGCFALSLPVAQAKQQSEDRGNGNSAAEDVQALNLSTTGSANTAHGWFSLFSNTTGSSNTGDGFQALYSNITGSDNTASGFTALYSNTTGSGNTADGIQALYSNTTGNVSTAIGVNALYNNTTGGANTALGWGAGGGIVTANNVLCIGANVFGADVSNSTWIANVYGVTTQSGTTAPVIVSNSGQLGTVASSERFKKDIATMEKASEAILSLRPVTFHYRADATKTPQFGLVAEEVAKVNPALVLPDKEGKPYTVRYDQVNAMLLNEFLKEHRKNEEQEKTIAELKSGITALAATVKEQARQIQKVSAQLEASKPAPQVVNNP